MNKTCEITQDLLPLYCDGICSESSAEMVRNHLSECKECQTMLTNLENGSTVNLLKGEANKIISHHNQAVKKKSLTVVIAVSAVLAVPMLITFIVNLATGKTLDWFFIVLTSLLVVASVTVVPLIAEIRKIFWTITSLTVSILLLLLSTCAFSKGDWFFMAAVPFLLGMSILFMPIILKQLPLKSDWLNGKIALMSMIIDTLFLYATVITAGIYTSALNYWSPALLITTFNVLVVWSVFLFIRYTKFHVLTKAGVVTIISGLVTVFANDIIMWFNGYGFTFEILKANLSSWNVNNLDSLDANIKLLVLLSCIIFGVLLLVIGCVLNKKKAVKEISSM